MEIHNKQIKYTRFSFVKICQRAGVGQGKFRQKILKNLLKISKTTPPKKNKQKTGNINQIHISSCKRLCAQC